MSQATSAPSAITIAPPGFRADAPSLRQLGVVSGESPEHPDVLDAARQLARLWAAG